MKAKEYFEKYFTDLDDISVDESNERIIKFMQDLKDETISICDMRHSRLNRSCEGALKDQNNKFNAVGNLIEKKYGRPLFKRNGFINFWHRRFEEEMNK